jgi:hypothetical protein
MPPGSTSTTADLHRSSSEAEPHDIRGRGSDEVGMAHEWPVDRHDDEQIRRR